MKPKLYIIAGPNGAGKTTFAYGYLKSWASCENFINADEIAKQLSPKNPEAAAFQAGRSMLEKINMLAKRRSSFAIETTLSGKSYLSWLKKLKANGYEIHLFFLWLPDVQLSLNRVADRVRKGGHNIPSDVIRRRYAAGIKNLFAVYRPVLDTWTLFDNSPLKPYMVATETGGKLTILDKALLQQFMKTPAESDNQQVNETSEIPEWMKAMSAMRVAVSGIIDEHLKTGHPLIIWRNGKIYRQPPEEARREMDEALENDPLLKGSKSTRQKHSLAAD